jgi:hypothetical protein
MAPCLGSDRNTCHANKSGGTTDCRAASQLSAGQQALQLSEEHREAGACHKFTVEKHAFGIVHELCWVGVLCAALMLCPVLYHRLCSALQVP